MRPHGQLYRRYVEKTAVLTQVKLDEVAAWLNESWKGSRVIVWPSRSVGHSLPHHQNYCCWQWRIKVSFLIEARRLIVVGRKRVIRPRHLNLA
jgi:hypothetical protein